MSWGAIFSSWRQRISGQAQRRRQARREGEGGEEEGGGDRGGVEEGRFLVGRK